MSESFPDPQSWSSITRCRSNPQVAIVHDYLTQRGGAERVVLSMLRAFPGASLYTAVYEPASTFPEFAEFNVLPLWTNGIRPLHRDHRLGLFLYPLAFSTLRVEADIVLSSSSGFAHGTGASPDSRRVVYCYTPARWLYKEADRYLAGFPPTVRAVLRSAAPALRVWDRRAATKADAYITTSTAVAKRIRETYGIEAAVVPPPIQFSAHGPREPLEWIEPGFVVCVARLLSYKNVDVVIESFNLLHDRRLVIVGDGPEREKLTALAGANVTFTGCLTDAQLRWLYAHCSGVVCAAYEDFGLTPLEAAALGKPAAVLRAGGFLDTVREGKTGVFFDRPEPELVREAVSLLLETSWDEEAIAGHAASFDIVGFTRRLRALVVPDHRDALTPPQINGFPAATNYGN